jgi:hypothetical protein
MKKSKDELCQNYPQIARIYLGIIWGWKKRDGSIFFLILVLDIYL